MIAPAKAGGIIAYCFYQMYNRLRRMVDEIDPYLPYKRTEGMTLPEYVEFLLRQGKRSQDEEFQTLLRAFGPPGSPGRKKIIDMAKEILEKEKLNELK